MVKSSGKNPTNLRDISNGSQDKPSLHSGRLEVEAQEKTREREGDTRVSLARARSLFSPTTSKPATQAKGPVIIYQPGGGGLEDFGGDHLIFRRPEGGISRN